MLTKVMFVSRTAAENIPGWEDGAIVSITEPEVGQAKLMQGWYAIHRSEFHDAEPQKAVRDPMVVMMEEQAIDIVDFVHSVAPHVNAIVVHCKGGISRSAAVAKWIAETFKLPFNHQYSLYNKYVYHQLNEAHERRNR